MASFWNFHVRRFIQTTAARHSADAHGTSEGIYSFACAIKIILSEFELVNETEIM